MNTNHTETKFTRRPEQFAPIIENRERIGITNAANFAKRIRIYEDATRVRGSEIYQTWRWNKTIAADIEKILKTHKK